MAWNHAGGCTVWPSASSFRMSAMEVFWSIPSFQMQAALMMQRMDVTRPNWLSCQSLKVLSNMAIPVADSARIRVLPEDYHLPLPGWVRLQRLERQLAHRHDPRVASRPDERRRVREGLDRRLQQRQPRLPAAREEPGKSERVVRARCARRWLLAVRSVAGHEFASCCSLNWWQDYAGRTGASQCRQPTGGVRLLRLLLIQSVSRDAERSAGPSRSASRLTRVTTQQRQSNYGPTGTSRAVV